MNKIYIQVEEEEFVIFWGFPSHAGEVMEKKKYQKHSIRLFNNWSGDVMRNNYHFNAYRFFFYLEAVRIP